MSTGARKILLSRDLVKWEDPGLPALDDESWAAAKAIGRNFWAPDVARLGNRWMLYLTCYNSADDSKIVAFSSENPEGPFHIVGIVTDGSVTGIRDTIDPELVCEDGRVWLFFGSVGRIHRAELSADGCSVISDYVPVAGLTDGENPERDKVFEGCYLHRHKGWWYLFASAGQYWNHTYRIVVGRSRSLDGVFVDRDGRPMTEGNATTVISSDESDRFYGPGHNGEIFRDRLGRDFILYHCHSTDNEKASVRNTLLQQIKWARDGWPYVDGGKPVSEAAAPRFFLLKRQ